MSSLVIWLLTACAYHNMLIIKNAYAYVYNTKCWQAGLNHWYISYQVSIPPCCSNLGVQLTRSKPLAPRLRWWLGSIPLHSSCPLRPASISRENMCDAEQIISHACLLYGQIEIPLVFFSTVFLGYGTFATVISVRAKSVRSIVIVSCFSNPLWQTIAGYSDTAMYE